MKHPAPRANWAQLRFALRETAGDLRDLRFWAVIGGVIVLVALAGPFYTMENLGLGARLVYWGALGVASALVMWTLNRLCALVLPRRWPPLAVGALAGAIGVLPMTGLVALGNLAAGLGLPQAGFWGLLPYVAPTVIGVSALVHMLVGQAPDAAPAAPPPAGLFARLPADLGRDIIAVQAQDHYINVMTPRGNRLILLRMGDATQDLASLRGMQIHRSWWVGLDHVERLENSATGGARLWLSNGLQVPVPRSRRAAVRQAIAAPPPRGE